MQEELTAEYPELNISLLSINMIGAESGTAQAAQSGTLPIVNDNETSLLWENWGNTASDSPETELYCIDNSCGNWRDVFILDRQNQPIAIYNLTLHNLSDEANFAELKQILIDAASQ